MAHKFKKIDLIEILDNILNKTLGEVDVNDVFNKVQNGEKITGIAGDVIEQSVLKYKADNKQEPDLDVDGILTELKTTGIHLSKKEKDRYEAKEPLSVTAVSPDNIVDEEFYQSKFWHKLEHILFVYYLYVYKSNSKEKIQSKDYADFYIKGYQFYEFNKEDEKSLKNDWEMVRNFIRDSKRHFTNPKSQYSKLSTEINENLFLIDTAPKWPNNPRFRLKRTVMNNIIQKHFGQSLEQIPGKYTSYKDIDLKCHEISSKYQGMTIKELIKEFNIDIKGNISKSITEQIIVRMFGGKSKKLNNIDLFNKIGLIGKTITVTPAGLRTEDMKLFPIDFDEWLDKDKTFEDSMIYEYFTNHQFICMIFKESNDKNIDNNVFVGFKRLSFYDNEFEIIIKNVWENIRNLVNNNELKEKVILDKNNNILFNKTGIKKTALNFPKSRDSVIFARGSGIDSNNKNTEINGIKMYKQYIWLKGKYIAELLEKIPLL